MMNKEDLDKKYMRRAIELASRAKGGTYPNPMVGAIITDRGTVLGEGFHRKAGEDHAEVQAIMQAGKKARGGTMYVSLEPCDHYGRTPPCTQAIIKSGIKSVKIAMKDPNPVNNGRGIGTLRAAGIKVETGIERAMARDLNRKYMKYIILSMPYVTGKIAQSLDGRIAAKDGSSKWITSTESRDHYKQLRSKYDAVMIGSNTLVMDDPFLLDRDRKGYDVVRIIVDSRLRTPPDCNVLRTSGKSPVIVATTEQATSRKIEKISGMDNVEVLVCKMDGRRVSLRSLLGMLAQREIVDLLVEGGGELLGSFFDDSLLDEMIFYIAPKIIGDTGYDSLKGGGSMTMDGIRTLERVSVESRGHDMIVSGRIKRRG